MFLNGYLFFFLKQRLNIQQFFKHLECILLKLPTALLKHLGDPQHNTHEIYIRPNPLRTKSYYAVEILPQTPGISSLQVCNFSDVRSLHGGNLSQFCFKDKTLAFFFPCSRKCLCQPSHFHQICDQTPISFPKPQGLTFNLGPLRLETTLW